MESIENMRRTFFDMTLQLKALKKYHITMARLSSQYSNNLNMQYIHYIPVPYFLFLFCIFFILRLYFSFCFYIFYISSH